MRTATVMQNKQTALLWESLSTAFEEPVRKIHCSLLFHQPQIPCGPQSVYKKNVINITLILNCCKTSWALVITWSSSPCPNTCFRLILKHEDLSPAEMQLRKCKQYDTCGWSLHKLRFCAPLLIHNSVEETSCNVPLSQCARMWRSSPGWCAADPLNNLGLWPPVYKLLQLFLDFE